MSGLEKLLKTRIPAAPENSNVLHSQEPGHSNALSTVRPQTPKSVAELSVAAVKVLERLKAPTIPGGFPTLQVSATVYVGGYIARVVNEHIECENCVALTTKPLSSQPLQ